MYAASKASLIQGSEIWRLELAPLNVRVIVLITGGIATQFLSNMPSLELPENSYYRSVKDIIAKEPEEIPFAVKPEALAKDVLNHVERGSTGKIWIGGASGMARFAVWGLPQWLLVSILSCLMC
jgi:1-acylglycerone phosphate reductase